MLSLIVLAATAADREAEGESAGAAMHARDYVIIYIPLNSV